VNFRQARLSFRVQNAQRFELVFMIKLHILAVHVSDRWLQCGTKNDLGKWVDYS